MDQLPVFLDLRGRRVVVIGGGEVAARKVRMLQRAAADVLVVAPELHAELADEASHGRIQHRAGLFHATDLDEVWLVVAATGDAEVNRAISKAAAERRIFVNAVDDSAACSLLMPAIVDRSPLVMAVGTGGGAPVLARRTRAQLEALFPNSLSALAAAATRWRERARSVLPDTDRRRRFWDRFYSGAAALPVTAEGLDRHIERALDAAAAAARAGGEDLRGEVWLIGAGPGDPDLLTLRALQLLQECDVVLYDRLVSDAVLERVRRDAERIFVGKEYGSHRATQTYIHELMLEHARRGRRVARLKGGDPMVFARGGEELAVLAAAGIPVTVVPGVTAALGAAAAAGIPLTHRGISQAVTFVTAMGEAAAALDWRALAAPLQTAVFYMGMTQLPQIIARLRAHGAPGGRAAAIVESATLAEERLVTGTLDDIVERSVQAQVRAPALLIVGDVVLQAAGAPRHQPVESRAGEQEAE